MTTYSDIRDELSEVLDCVSIEFLPANNMWSQKRQKDLMANIEDTLIHLKSYRCCAPYDLDYPMVCQARKAEGGISIKIDGGIHTIRFPHEFNCGWMDPGLNGDDLDWHNWKNNTNFMKPDVNGHTILKLLVKDSPRCISMALKTGIQMENRGNKIISPFSPPDECFIWECFNSRLDKKQLKESKKIISEYHESIEGTVLVKNTENHPFGTVTTYKRVRVDETV